MTLAGFVLLFRPSVLLNLMRKYQNTLALYVLAVSARLILGAALLAAAPASRYPMALEVLGWLAIAAAIVIGSLGRTKFSKMLVWALGLPDSLGRVAGIIAVIFGGFLVYALR